MTYEDMGDYMDEFYDCDYIESFYSLEDFAQSVQREFNGIPFEVAMDLAEPLWLDCLEAGLTKDQMIDEDTGIVIEKPKPKPKEVKVTKTQETDIKNVIQNEDLTKREVSIRTLEIVNKPFSLQQFYDETGMIQSTARRELGQAVKRGEIERVSRGVYRRL